MTIHLLSRDISPRISLLIIHDQLEKNDFNFLLFSVIIFVHPSNYETH